MPLLNRIRQFDAYAKTADDFRTQTFTGGLGILSILTCLVTIASVILVLLLSSAAFSEYRTVRWQSEVKIDQPLDTQKIKVSFDIIFPRLPCYGIHKFQNNLVENISKIRLNAEGFELGYHQEILDLSANPDYCGSCYSAADLADPEHSALREDDAKNKKNGICCNSCSSVFDAYSFRKQSSPRLADIEQCVKEGWVDRMKSEAGEGCRVKGHFLVDHSSSDFHFGPGRSYNTPKGVHVHDLRPFESLDFDFSHRILSLKFDEAGTDNIIIPDGFELSEPLKGVDQDSTDSTSFGFSFF